MLLLAKLTPEMDVAEERMFALVSNLKDGKGLAIVAAAVEGDVLAQQSRTQAAYRSLRAAMRRNETLGFAQVVAGATIGGGVSYLIQAAGLGALRHNTVVMGLPERWRTSHADTWFVDAIRTASALNLAVIIPCNVAQFPGIKDEMRGTIDVWWVVHDGGMLLLLAFLLQKDRVWKHCRIRVFTVARVDDNTIQLERDLALFMYSLRIEADVAVIEVVRRICSAAIALPPTVCSVTRTWPRTPWSGQRPCSSSGATRARCRPPQSTCRASAAPRWTGRRRQGRWTCCA